MNKTMVLMIKTMVSIIKSSDSISNLELIYETMDLKPLFVQNVRVKPWFCSESRVLMNYCANGLPYADESNSLLHLLRT